MLSFIAVLSLAGTLLLISLILLHKFLKRGFCMGDIVGFGFDARAFLRIFIHFESGTGFIGSDDPL
jgi:hypothetical protein